MELIIRNTTNQPIYDQIYSQIKALELIALICLRGKHDNRNL